MVITCLIIVRNKKHMAAFLLKKCVTTRKAGFQNKLLSSRIDALGVEALISALASYSLAISKMRFIQCAKILKSQD